MLELHVVRTAVASGVLEDRVPGALSEHPSATDAQMAAWWHAERRGAERIVVHDRYSRTRDAIPRPDARAAHEVGGAQP